MYFAIYTTEQEALDAERIAFHAALHAIAAENGYAELYNSVTKLPMPLEDITLEYVTDNPTHIGFLGRTLGQIRYDVPPMISGGAPEIVIAGDHTGAYALRISNFYIAKGFDLALPTPLAVSSDDSIVAEEEE